MKIIVVTGGVLSGLGKGVAVASIGFLFDDYKIKVLKLDGYLNSDPGTMNPIEHGEVFVLEDGAEVDMDFGHYERFIGINCKREDNITMGKVFHEIWEKERRGDYLGKTVQLIPHVTDLIKEKIIGIKKENLDILIIEIGGTVGDMENELFIEAIRQLKSELPRNEIVFIHLTYVPIPFGVKEQKTKPTQQSVRILKSKGINPDIILGRCSQKLKERVKAKIALFSDLKKEDVFSAVDVDNIYKIPLFFEDDGIGSRIAQKLGIEYKVNERIEIIKKLVSKKPSKKIRIGIAGKYIDLEDSYASIIEAIKHNDMFFGIKTDIIWVDTSKEEDLKKLKEVDGIIVPGGFGERGVEGKIKAIEIARTNNIPFLGICYGMQLAVVEFARNVCGLKKANTTEVDPNTPHPIITLLDEQRKITKLGGTMRLGGYEAMLSNGIIKKLYKELGLYKVKDGKFIVSERHRHRYEVNPEYHKILEENGLRIVGKNEMLAEFIELPNHKYFVGTQGHPELKSKPDKPAPLFYGLFKAILEK